MFVNRWRHIPPCPYGTNCKLHFSRDAAHDDQYSHPSPEAEDDGGDREIEVLTKPLPEPPRGGGAGAAAATSSASAGGSKIAQHPPGYVLLTQTKETNASKRRRTIQKS